MKQNEHTIRVYAEPAQLFVVIHTPVNIYINKNITNSPTSKKLYDQQNHCNLNKCAQ